MLSRYSPIVILSLIFSICLINVAYAQQVAATTEAYSDLTWWQLLLKHGIELAFFIITIMISAFVNTLGKKYKFEDYTNKINDVLARASGYAEQKALGMAKLKGKPLQSAQKMQVALNFAESLAKDYKLPKKGADWWEDKLESWLGVGKDEAFVVATKTQALKAKPAEAKPIVKKAKPAKKKTKAAKKKAK